MYVLLTSSSNYHSLQSYQRCEVGSNYSAQLMISFKLSFLSCRAFTDNCWNITRLCHVWLGKYTNCRFITITMTMTAMTWQAREKMNLSALLGRVELFCTTPHHTTPQRTNSRDPRQADGDCQNSQRETSPSYTAVVGSLFSQMVISIIISCSLLETGAVDIWETSSKDQKFLLRKS